MGLGHTSISKAFAFQHEDLSSNPRAHVKKLSMVVHVYNPPLERCTQKDLWDFFFSGQPVQPISELQTEMGDTFQKTRWTQIWQHMLLVPELRGGGGSP